MTTNEQRVRTLIAESAADWFVANRAGLTPIERAAFASWLKASPLHVEEYLALSVTARDLREACREAQGSIDELVARARLEDDSNVLPLSSRLLSAVREFALPRWQTAAAAAAACAVASVALVVLWTHNAPAPGTTNTEAATALHFATGHGEQQTHVLADSSVLHLNSDSAATVRYSRSERLVTLTSGEAVFEVAHLSGRPFRVLAGSAEVVDIGTKFDVRLNSGSTAVAVLEGRVAVRPSPAADTPGNGPDRAARFVQLGVDQQITVGDGNWPATPVDASAQRTTAWLHRQIMFEQEPLERVASEFNRYAAKQIEITTPALRKLQISGVFATDDTQAFIAFLRSLDGVHVEVTDRQIRVSQN